MENAIAVLIYTVCSILFLLLSLIFFILIVPLRYFIAGGYKKRPWCRFSLSCSPALIVAGTWDQEDNKVLKIRLILLGMPIKLDPQKFKDKKKPVKTKKERKKKGTTSILIILDRELKVRGFALFKNLLRILKPDLLSLKGKVGFEEPHLTGWLAAFTQSLKFCCKNESINLEPIWEEECCELEALICGRIMTGLILLKISWFFLWLKVRQLFNSSKKEEPAISSNL